MTEKVNFDQWCVVELFGHQVIAGKVSEQEIGGCSFIRVDVPTVEGSEEFTRFFSQGAIYSISPVSEEVAKIAVKDFCKTPISVYSPTLNKLMPGFEDNVPVEF